MRKKDHPPIPLIYRLTLFGTALLLSGCMSSTQLGYQDFIHDLDGQNDLVISTYPAWYPSRKKDVPYTYTHLETHDRVLFQIIIQDKKRSLGPNETIKSAQIKSFSYQLDDGESIELLKNHKGGSWMQTASQYKEVERVAIPYKPGSVLSVKIELSYNGKNYSFEGEMPASEKRKVYPLLLDPRSP